MANGNKIRNNNKVKSGEDSLRDKLKKIGATVLAIFGTAAYLELNKAVNKDVGLTKEFAQNVERIDATSITIQGGPKLRMNPEVQNGTDGVKANNVIWDFGESDQEFTLSYDGPIYAYEKRGDADGKWIGFPAEEFANTLYESSYIDEKTRDKMIDKEQGDGRDHIVWINGKYVKVNEDGALSENKTNEIVY